MKKRKLIISSGGLLLLIIIGVCIFLFLGKGTSVTGLFNIDAGPKTGPVGTWDTPIPEINPLGSQGLYAGTEYGVGDHTVKFVENYQETSRLFSGEYWTLSVKDDSETPLKYLRDYADKIGAKVYSSPYSDTLTFSMEKQNDVAWWGDAQQSTDGYTLTVMKEIYALPDKALTFKHKDLGESIQSVSFATKSSGDRFQAATISLPSGDVKVTANYKTEKGVLSREFDYSKDLDSIKTNRFVLDDIPQNEGTLIWKITWDQDKAPEEFTFLLQELYDIPKVKMGDEMGALKVCGIPFGTAKVEVPVGGYVDHADGYSLDGDITPEGDTLFNLPAGYWNVVLRADGIGITSSMTRLVPVNTGELTTLTLPNSLKSTYSNLNSMYSSGGDNAGGIEFMETKDLTDTAEVSFVVNDPKKRDIYPSNTNMVVTEGGQEVKILDITRQISPPSIVLLLDSSGSMQKEMSNTLDSAKKFIQGLPDGSFIQVIDFATEVKVLNGTTKDEAVKSLGSIKANGSTVLYDSIIKGLEILNGKTRPALVVFTDGVDSSTDNSGKGSSATKDDVIEAVKQAKEAGIPLFTIGFGTGHDSTTLSELASLSGGEYYPAKDQKALSNVFTAINSKFGNYFKLTYERPKETAKSDVPVVSIVVDNSGSMDTDPKEEEGCDYRIDKVKGLLHDFVCKLPDNCLTQMMKFNTSATGDTIINVDQLTTQNKPQLLQALGEMEASNGTPILDSITAAYENINPIPTTKRVIVYVTDAALEVSPEEDAQFVEMLKKIKDDNIQVIWVGIGVEDKKDVFARAADISGGRYVVSNDVNTLQSTLSDVLALVNQPKPSEKTLISISIDDKTPSGDIMNYSNSENVVLSAPKTGGIAASPDGVKTAAGTALKRYDKDAAELIYGTDTPSKDTIISKRIQFSSSTSNKAMELKPVEAYYLKSFKGFKDPTRQFLVIEMEMKNITEQKIPYEIPNFTSHFYVSFNNEGMYPASVITWLAQTPAANPGEYSIGIKPGETRKGVMIFAVPDEPSSQLSLHFYDTDYGHINIPLIGTMSQDMLNVDKLPTTQPVDITDAFSINVQGVSVVPKLDTIEASNNTSFKVIDASFKSKVQALLDIDPSSRLLLGIDTAQGPLLTKISTVTERLPFGFMKPVMLAPASNNTVRFAYQIPSILSGAKTSIYGDLKDGALQIPVTNGPVYGSASSKPKISGDGMDMAVNDLVRLSGVEGYGDNYVVADITIFDRKDGQGTTGFKDAFALVRDDYDESNQAGNNSVGRVGLGNFGSGDSSEYVITPNASTDELLYGIGGDFSVFDNSSRRGLVIFSLPDDSTDHSWTLRSPYFSDLKEPIGSGSYGSSGLLVNKTNVDNICDDFEKELSDAISTAVNKYNMTKMGSGDTGYDTTLGLADKEGAQNNIPVPAIVLSGSQKVNAVKTIDDFKNTMEKLKWLPSEDESWYCRYSPEAVLTQGWGTEWDLANLALGMLSRLGYHPYARMVMLTDEGRKNLLNLAGITDMQLMSIPAIAYVDEKGTSNLFVIPFMKDISELDGLVYMVSSQSASNPYQQSANVAISIKAVPLNQNAASDINESASALAGDDNGGSDSYEYIDIFSKDLTMTSLSLDAIDIGFVKAGRGKGDVYKTAVNTASGLVMSDNYIDSGDYKVLGVKIVVSLPRQDPLVHETTLLDGQTLEDLYHTVGINLPDLPSEAANALQKAAGPEYNGASNPDAASALRWYTRSILDRFIATQSEFDEKTAKALNVTLGRTGKARSIVITASMDQKNNKLRTSVDLMQATNQVHSGEQNAQNAYNIGAGVFVSQLEGRVLPSGSRADIAEIWSSVPSDASYFMVMNDEQSRNNAIDQIKDSGYPPMLLQHIKELGKIFIVPDKPAVIDGEEHWAWLEIDPSTYDAISVLDTGEHSGMAEYVINMLPSVKECRDYMAGAFVGVSTSVWAVSTFALVMDDYNDILDNAKALVNATADYIDFVMKGTKKGEPGVFKIFTEKAGPVKVEMKIKWDLNLSVNPELSTGNNFNIVTGFKDGAAFYFTHAEAAAR